MPYPPNKGERVRAFHELKALSKEFRITLATLTHGKEDADAAGMVRQWCEKVIVARTGPKRGFLRSLCAMLRGKSATEGYFHSRRLEKKLRKETRRNLFHLAMGYSSSMFPYLKNLSVPYRVLDLVDVDSAKWFSYANTASWPRSWLYRREGRKVCRLEQDVIVHCEAVFLVSQAESSLLGHYPEKVSALENGVDTDYFTPRKKFRTENPSLVFTGTMDYRPNIEGVCWFVQEVWPELKRQIPDLTFYIVGRNPARDVRRLGYAPGVQITGSVPDVRPYLAEASIAVCRLLMARGVQNKVLEAMAMGRAVIASTSALEGLELEVGKEVLQADLPQQWIQTTIQLLTDNTLREEMARKARKAVETRYNWTARMAPLVQLCHQLTGDKTGPKQVETVAGEKAPQNEVNEIPVETETPIVPERVKTKINRARAVLLWLIALGYLWVVYRASVSYRLPVIGTWNRGISNELQNLLHMPAYAMLMVCMSLALTASIRFRLVGVIFSVIICFSFGVLMEYVQKTVGRTFDKSDIILDSIGIILALPAALSWRWQHMSSGLGVYSLFKRRRKSQRRQSKST